MICIDENDRNGFWASFAERNSACTWLFWTLIKRFNQVPGNPSRKSRVCTQRAASQTWLPSASLGRRYVTNPNHSCARLTITQATTPNTILGSQIPTMDGILGSLEKTTENLDINTNIAPIEMPIARCKPMPPLTFRAAIATPMMVRMIMVNGSAVRR